MGFCPLLKLVRWPVVVHFRILLSLLGSIIHHTTSHYFYHWRQDCLATNWLSKLWVQANAYCLLEQWYSRRFKWAILALSIRCFKYGNMYRIYRCAYHLFFLSSCDYFLFLSKLYLFNRFMKLEQSANYFCL